MLQGKRKKKYSLSNSNTIVPTSPSPDLVIPAPQAGHTVEHHSFNTDDNVNREKQKISEGKYSQLELHYERPTSFQGEAYQHTIDLKKEITEDVGNADQIQQPSVIQAPSSRVIKGLRTSVIQHTHSLPKR